MKRKKERNVVKILEYTHYRRNDNYIENEKREKKKYDENKYMINIQ